jgi:hypothetical protein
MVRTPIRRLTVFLLCIALIGGVAAGCGSSKSKTTGTTASSKTIHFATAKFALHAGLAFGAFHRYIYKPFKAGDFAHPSTHKAALVKGGLAALFAVHEIKIAAQDARSSKVLSKLGAPIAALETKLGSLGTDLKAGRSNGSLIQSTNTDVTSIGSQSAASGTTIKEHAPPLSAIGA